MDLFSTSCPKLPAQSTLDSHACIYVYVSSPSTNNQVPPSLPLNQISCPLPSQPCLSPLKTHIQGKVGRYLPGIKTSCRKNKKKKIKMTLCCATEPFSFYLILKVKQVKASKSKLKQASATLNRNCNCDCDCDTLGGREVTVTRRSKRKK